LGLVHPTGLALFDINHLENKLKGKTAQGWEIRQLWVYVLVPSFTACLTLSKLHKLSPAQVDGDSSFPKERSEDSVRKLPTELGSEKWSLEGWSPSIMEGPLFDHFSRVTSKYGLQVSSISITWWILGLLPRPTESVL
jgi:hypothetical protein